MTSPVFPVLPGLGWSVKRTPAFKSIVQESVSGKETRVALWSYPRYAWELSYEFLRDDAAGELRALEGFFLQRQGAFGTFLYADPDDGSVAGQALGIGDGAATVFPFLRSFGGFAEPVGAVAGSPSLYKADWQGTQRQYATPRENLVLHAQDFESGWTLINATIGVDAQTAPDGSTTADKLAETATANVSHLASQTVAGIADNATIVVSVHMLPAERSWGFLNVVDKGGAIHNCYFDLSGGGGIGNSKAGSPISPTITALPSGWYRCGFAVDIGTGATTPTMSPRTALGDGQQSYTGTAGAGLYLWGAQVEVAQGGNLPSSYIPTTAAAVAVTDYALVSTDPAYADPNAAQFAVAPAAGAAISADFSYCFRVRFAEDSQDYEKFMAALWQLKKLSFVSVK